jgi:hypothetical protein
MFIMSLATADLIVGLIVIPLSATAFIFGPGTQIQGKSMDPIMD